VHFDSSASRPGVPVVSVLAPPDERLRPVVMQLQNELKEEFDVLVTALERSGGGAEVGEVMLRDRPKAVILLNNSTARAYRAWAKTAPSPPVSIILMASFADQLQRTIPNSVGIAYEVPAVTSLVGLRALGKAVGRVGVVHRRALSSYVNEQRELALVERIEFVTEELDDDFETTDLKAALVRLRRAEVDVLWLPNDNALLTRRLVSTAWLPYLERLRLPVVVGVPSLVSPDPGFGIFGANPDPEALAIQAADLVFDLDEDDWLIRQHDVRLPLSARTYLSAPLGRRYGIRTADIGSVDVVVGDRGAD
jgi:putative ABC transport system substrate-binding protein